MRMTAGTANRQPHNRRPQNLHFVSDHFEPVRYEGRDVGKRAIRSSSQKSRCCQIVVECLVNLLSIHVVGQLVSSQLLLQKPIPGLVRIE